MVLSVTRVANSGTSLVIVPLEGAWVVVWFQATRARKRVTAVVNAVTFQESAPTKALNPKVSLRSIGLASLIFFSSFLAFPSTSLFLPLRASLSDSALLM